MEVKTYMVGAGVKMYRLDGRRGAQKEGVGSGVKSRGCRSGGFGSGGKN